MTLILLPLAYIVPLIVVVGIEYWLTTRRWERERQLAKEMAARGETWVS